MQCENLQFNLSIYLDDILMGDERAVVEEHLRRCPVCRQKLADFQSLRTNLRVLQRPELPNELLTSLRNRVAREIKSNPPESAFPQIRNVREWLQMRFMPYSVGTIASLLLGLTLLWSLLSATNNTQRNIDLAKSEPFTKSNVLLANSNPKRNTNEVELNAADFAAARLSVSNDSPSINPHGALVALTKSFVRGKMKDDEVVVVADVFGNGLAQITEVVEPSRDLRAVRELEEALKHDSDYAPFVPANLDQRSEIVRVIFKIQSVNVDTHTKQRKK